MQTVLDEIASRTKIDIVFSSDRVKGRSVYCAKSNATSRELVACALESVDMDYVVSSSGAIIVIDSVEAPELVGHLAGRVIDEDSRTPLPDANVLIADAAAGTATNADGLFSFSSLVTGWHDLIVTYVGYEPVQNRVLVTSGQPARVELRMRRAVRVFDPVVVDGLAQRLPSQALGSEQSLEAARNLGGLYAQDVIRGASSLPGIAATRPVAELYIQGSPSSEHLTLLDGAPVRDPVSLGRHLSAFSPLALASVDVQKAGFDASKGSHLAGVVRVEQVTHSGGPPAFSLQADPASANARASASVPLGGARLDIMTAIRHSTWDVYHAPSVNDLLNAWNVVDPLIWSLWSSYRTPDQSGYVTGIRVLDRRPDVRFSDAHLAGHVSLGRFQSVGFSAYRAGNNIASDMLSLVDLEEKNNVLSLSRDTYSWTNWAGQVNYAGLLGSRSMVNVRATASSHDSSIEYATRIAEVGDPALASEIDATARALRDSIAVTTGAYEGNAINEYRLSAGIDHSLSPSLSIEGELFAGRADARFRVANQFIYPLWSASAANEFGAFVNASISFGLHWQLEPGLRWTWLPNLSTGFAEPRIAMRHDSGRRSWGSYAVRVAGGVYRQFTQQYDVSSGGPTAIVPSIRFWLPLDASLSPPRAYHVAAELLAMPTGPVTLRTEVYYKDQPRLLLVDYPAIISTSNTAEAPPARVMQDDFVSSGSGYAWGANAKIEYEGPVDLTGSYGFSQAKRTFPGRFDGRKVATPWNEPHRFGASVAIPVTSALKATAVWQSAWGRRWSFRHAYYDYLGEATAPPALPDVSSPDKDAAPDTHQLDVTFAYTTQYRAANLRIEVGIQNLLNHENVYDFGIGSANRGDPVARRLPGRQPVFVIRADF